VPGVDTSTNRLLLAKSPELVPLPTRSLKIYKKENYLQYHHECFTVRQPWVYSFTVQDRNSHWHSTAMWPHCKLIFAFITLRWVCFSRYQCLCVSSRVPLFLLSLSTNAFVSSSHSVMKWRPRAKEWHIFWSKNRSRLGSAFSSLCCSIHATWKIRDQVHASSFLRPCHYWQ
jgi:hypothetical protein